MIDSSHFENPQGNGGAKMKVPAAIVLRSVLASTNLWAQATSQINGAIRDSNGLAVPNAKVKAKQTATSAVRTTLSGRTEPTCWTFPLVRTCLRSPQGVLGNLRKPGLMRSGLRDASEWVTRSSWRLLRGWPVMPQLLDYSLARGDTYVLGRAWSLVEANPETIIEAAPCACNVSVHLDHLKGC